MEVPLFVPQCKTANHHHFCMGEFAMAGTQFERPYRDVEFQDWIDLSRGRSWGLLFEDTDSIESIPRIWLEQYRQDVQLEHGWDEADVTGRMWLYPEDLPAVIAKLQVWLEQYRECAREDAKRRPPPNWGRLLAR